MAIHPRSIVGYEGSLDQLAQEIANMSSNRTASFIEKLADDIKRQADDDSNIKNRNKLSARLYEAANELYSARDSLGGVCYQDNPFNRLAKPVGNMAYDQTALFIEKLAYNIRSQADASNIKGKEKAVAYLFETERRLHSARDKLIKAWEICKPYMREEAPQKPLS